jgi:hypothetical protein
MRRGVDLRLVFSFSFPRDKEQMKMASAISEAIPKATS